MKKLTKCSHWCVGRFDWHYSDSVINILNLYYWHLSFTKWFINEMMLLAQESEPAFSMYYTLSSILSIYIFKALKVEYNHGNTSPEMVMDHKIVAPHSICSISHSKQLLQICWPSWWWKGTVSKWCQTSC